jgi:hypothetical protein
MIIKTTATAVALLTTAITTNPAWSDGYGSGVAIYPHYILTANHVIDGCAEVSVSNFGATITARDAKNDLAVLYVQWAERNNYVLMRNDNELRIGDEILVAGFPLYGMLASSLNLTIGNISAMAGFKDNQNYYTITAPIQHGNSGGPLLDNEGHLAGIVTSQLKSEIAQNANFAVKYSAIKSFLDNNGIKYQTVNPSTKITAAEIGEKAKWFTYKITCHEGAKTVASAPPSQPPSQPSSQTTGYWTATAGDNACSLSSKFVDGRSVGIGVTRDLGLIALISKPTWDVPQNIRVSARVQIDNYPPLSGPGLAIPNWPNTIAIPVQPRFYNDLIYQMIEGWWATVTFTGNEPPWQVSLWGVKASWPAFVQCARRVSPAVVDRMYATQPW